MFAKCFMLFIHLYHFKYRYTDAINTSFIKGDLTLLENGTALTYQMHSFWPICHSFQQNKTFVIEKSKILHRTHFSAL